MPWMIPGLRNAPTLILGVRHSHLNATPLYDDPAHTWWRGGGGHMTCFVRMWRGGRGGGVLKTKETKSTDGVGRWHLLGPTPATFGNRGVIHVKLM